MAPKKNVYYVGAPSILDGSKTSPRTSGYCHAVLADAIEQARALVETDGQPRPVVQVLKVVERSRPPVVVRNPR